MVPRARAIDTSRRVTPHGAKTANAPEFLPRTRARLVARAPKGNARNTRGSVTLPDSSRGLKHVCEVPDGGRDADDGARESDDELDARKNGRGGADDDGGARCDVERGARWR